jgi:hypothetical protein
VVWGCGVLLFAARLSGNHCPLHKLTAKVNSLLRQVFEKVVVNYDGGQLEFHWQQGGSIGSVMFVWPSDQ